MDIMVLGYDKHSKRVINRPIFERENITDRMESNLLFGTLYWDIDENLASLSKCNTTLNVSNKHIEILKHFLRVLTKSTVYCHSAVETVTKDIVRYIFSGPSQTILLEMTARFQESGILSMYRRNREFLFELPPKIIQAQNEARSIQDPPLTIRDMRILSIFIALISALVAAFFGFLTEVKYEIVAKSKSMFLLEVLHVVSNSKHDIQAKCIVKT